MGDRASRARAPGGAVDAALAALAAAVAEGDAERAAGPAPVAPVAACLDPAAWVVIQLRALGDCASGSYLAEAWIRRANSGAPENTARALADAELLALDALAARLGAGPLPQWATLPACHARLRGAIVDPLADLADPAGVVAALVAAVGGALAAGPPVWRGVG